MFSNTIRLILLLYTIIYIAYASKQITLRSLPEPVFGQIFRFEFTPSEDISTSETFNFAATDSLSSSFQYPWASSIDYRFGGIFPETFSPAATTLPICQMYHPDDSNQRLKPNPCGWISNGFTPETASHVKFYPRAIIPHNYIVSCFIMMKSDKMLHTTTISLVPTIASNWTIQNPIHILPFNHDPYVDQLLLIEIEISYIQGDSIIAGERMDYISFQIDSLPPNRILPLSVGFDSSIESHLDRIFFLSNHTCDHISSLWGAFKPGDNSKTRDSSLTPDNPLFYDQTFDIPSTSCGKDVRLVYSSTQHQFFLATGENPPQSAHCSIPIPIFYLHASIAKSTIARQNVGLWSGTSIISYIRLHDRLYKQTVSKSGPKWWFYNNPHLVQYSGQTYSQTLQNPNDGGVSFSNQIIFLGPKPSFSLARFDSNPKFPLKKFFSKYQLNNTESGFLSHFAYFLSPTDIRTPNVWIPLTLNENDPFSHFQHFEGYNGYLSLILTFTMPNSQLTPFLLQLHNHGANNEIIHLSQGLSYGSSLTIPLISDTEISFKTTIQQSYHMVAYTSLGSSIRVGVLEENYTTFPFSIELTHFFLYEFRSADKLLPRLCTVDMFMTSQDGTIIPYAPVEPWQFHIQKISALSKNFAQDAHHFVMIENIVLDYGVSFDVTCTFDLHPNILKPPQFQLDKFPRNLLCWTTDYSTLKHCVKHTLHPFPIPSQPWNELPPALKGSSNLWFASSSKPIHTQADFTQLLQDTVHIIKNGIPFGSDPWKYKHCLTVDMLREPLIVSSTKSTISASYLHETSVSRSYSPNGWVESDTDPFTITSLSISPNGSIISFVIQSPYDSTCFSEDFIISPSFRSFNNVHVSVAPNHRRHLGYYALAPPIQFHGSEALLSQSPTGILPGGAKCYSHQQCVLACSDDCDSHPISPYMGCFKGKCTPPSLRSLNPFEYREFNTLTDNFFSKNRIKINTSFDFTPSEASSQSKLKFIILALCSLVVVLVIGFIAWEMFCHRKKKSPTKHSNEVLLDDDLFSNGIQ